MSQACAAIVERDDPHLYATALFAPEPARSQLMVLYAFDIELSRAARASTESLIPRMRLQWWRDVITEAEESKPLKAHEIAGPLAELIQQKALSPDLLNQMVDGREVELDLPMSEAASKVHQSLYGARTELAARIVLGAELTQPQSGYARHIGLTLSWAYGCRTAHRRISGGTYPVLWLPHETLSGLMRGEATMEWTSWCAGLGQVLKLDHRVAIASLGRRAAPAFLLILREHRALRILARDPQQIFGGLEDLDRPFDGLRLAWRGLTGRW